MPAGAASRYALGAGGVACGRCAPGAYGEPDLRLALRARRTALRAEGAARLCAGGRSRWLPSLAAIAALRYTPGADGVGARARLGACGSQVAASRYALGAEGIGAARLARPPGRLLYSVK